MAHSISARKRVRQNEKRRLLNRARRSTLKTQVRRAIESIGGGDAKQAQEQFVEACRQLDRSANRGTVHRNAAARRKSRLARKLNAMKAKAPAKAPAK